MSLNQAERDWIIIITLWIEFFYDLLWNNRGIRLKRHKKAKRLYLFEHITEGEGK